MWTAAVIKKNEVADNRKEVVFLSSVALEARKC